MTSPSPGVLRFRVAGVTVALLAGAGTLFAALHLGPAGVTTTAKTSVAIDGFILPRLDGPGDVRLTSFRGKPTVVVFFASWCVACRDELPGFARVARVLQSRVSFIGVNSLETGDGLAMAHQTGIAGWPLARDVDGVQSSGLHDALVGHGMPLTAYYDSRGKLLDVVLGAVTEDTLWATLRRLYAIASP
jgi:cytochrome c biogenesis protein CcmG, thiol:disulfide interchange protein DsbE